MKSELQNAVDRLRQKLHDLEVHSQDKQNKFTIDKQQSEIQRVELTGKVNEVIYHSLCKNKFNLFVLVGRTIIESQQTSAKRFGD